MAVGRGDIVEIPLQGFEPLEPDPLLSPCEDRTAKGLWQWSARRINMKVRIFVHISNCLSHFLYLITIYRCKL